MKVTFINKDEIANEMKLAGWHASVSAGKDEPDNYEAIAKHCIKAGHGTATRGMRFIFEISEVSRAFSHEFVRHEIGVGKVQRSQRYVDEDGFGYVTPESLKGKTVGITLPDSGEDGWVRTAVWDFDDLQYVIKQMYTGFVEEGAKKEDARYALTNATETSIRAVFDWEGLKQFCFRRCCNRAQWEIRAVAMEILKLVTEAYPFLGSQLGAHCDLYGFCPELPKGCGKAPSREEYKKYFDAGKFYLSDEIG